MSDPDRLVSEPDELLRSVLASSSDDGPSAADVARLSAQLSSVLPAGALTQAPTQPHNHPGNFAHHRRHQLHW